MKIIDEIRDKIMEEKYYKILFLGDSITSAEFVHPNFREIIEDVIKEKFEYEIDNWQIPYKFIRFFNSSFQGATSKDFVNTLEENIFEYNPDLVIVMLGTNDFWLKIRKEDSVKNIRNIIYQIKDKGIMTVYATSLSSLKDGVNIEFEKYVNLFNKNLVDTVDIYLDLFNYIRNLDLENIFTWKAYDDNSEIGLKKGDIDFIHPNSKGHMYIAEYILKKVFDIKLDAKAYLSEQKNRSRIT